MRQTWDPVPMVNTPTWSFPAPPPGDSLQAASLGLPDSDVLSRIRATYGPDVTVEIDRDHQLHVVCVLLEGPLRRTAGIDWFHPSSEMCALLPPELARS